MLFFNAFLEKVSHPLIDTTSLLPAAVDIPVFFFHLSVCVAKNKMISVSHSEIIFFPKSCSPSGYHDLMTSVLEIVISELLVVVRTDQTIFSIIIVAISGIHIRLRKISI